MACSVLLDGVRSDGWFHSVRGYCAPISIEDEHGGYLLPSGSRIVCSAFDDIEESRVASSVCLL